MQKKNLLRRDKQRTEAKLLSFAQYQDEITQSRRGNYGPGLIFDPNAFKAQREVQLSQEAKMILCMDPKTRNDEQRHIALVSLSQAVKAFRLANRKKIIYILMYISLLLQ